MHCADKCLTMLTYEINSSLRNVNGLNKATEFGSIRCYYLRKTRKTQKNRTLLPFRVNKEIIYDCYTMIVINSISTGRQNVPLCEELRFRLLASIPPRTTALSIFYRGNAIHGRHNLSVFKYARADRFTYFNINS